MELDSTVIVGILSFMGVLIGTFSGIVTSTKLTVYRIEQLEKKVDKHNSIIERTAVLERNQDTMWEKFDDLKAQITHNNTQ